MSDSNDILNALRGSLGLSTTPSQSTSGQSSSPSTTSTQPSAVSVGGETEKERYLRYLHEQGADYGGMELLRKVLRRPGV